MLHVCVKMLATFIDFIRARSATRPYKIYAYAVWKIKHSYEKYVINLLLFLFHRQIPESENCIFAQQHSLTT